MSVKELTFASNEYTHTKKKKKKKKKKKNWKCRFAVGLASFGRLGKTSDPLMISMFQSGAYYPKGQENWNAEK